MSVSVFSLFFDNQCFVYFKHFPGVKKTRQGVYFLFIWLHKKAEYRNLLYPVKDGLKSLFAALDRFELLTEFAYFLGLLDDLINKKSQVFIYNLWLNTLVSSDQPSEIKLYRNI